MAGFKLQISFTPEVVEPVSAEWQDIDASLGVIRVKGPNPFEPGQEFKSQPSDWKPVRELGRGAFGVVNEMVNIHNDLHVARKIMRMQGPRDGNELKEIMHLRATDSPFIVTYYGVDISEGDIWLFIEVMQESWDKICNKVLAQNGKIPDEILCKVAFSITSALDYFKNVHGGIHQDVKPSNILLGFDGSVKLADFGIAGYLQMSMMNGNDGCQIYLSPERYTEATFDVRSDVWALGLSLLEMASLRHPYAHIRDQFELMNEITKRPAPRFSSEDEAFYSVELVNFVHYCLQTDKNDRPKYSKRPEHHLDWPSLVEHSLIVKYSTIPVDVLSWYHTLQ